MKYFYSALTIVIFISCKNMNNKSFPILTKVSNDTLISWVKNRTFLLPNDIVYKGIDNKVISNDSINQIAESRDVRFDYYVNSNNQIVEVLIEWATDEDKLFYDKMAKLNKPSYKEEIHLKEHLNIQELLSTTIEVKKTKIQKVFKDNVELIEIYENDQEDRKSGNIDWDIVTNNDKLREQRVYELLDSNKVNTSRDYRNAAMVFQHGANHIAYKMAVKLMKKSIELDPKANKWLLAAAIDRYLLSIERAQVYGTQYQVENDGKWILRKIDTTIISDAERIKYGVKTLSQQREKIKKENFNLK